MHWLLDDRSLTAYEVSTVKGSDLASRHNPELMQAMWGPSLDPYEMVLTAMAISLSLSIRNQITKSIDEPKDSYQ